MNMKLAKSQKVLVVEDEGLIAHDISSRLLALGHEVIASVATAEEAIEKASEADIVLMDIRLDGRTDGIQAAATIRERHHKPVVFLTSHADRATLDRAKIAEPFGYIVKPLGPGSLHTSIEMALFKHRMQRQLEEREAWLQTILQSITDAVVVTDIHSRIVMLNRAAERLTGWVQPNARGELISKVVRLVSDDSENSAEDPVELATLRDSAVLLDSSAKLLGLGGREMAVEGTAAPVKVDGGTAGVVLTFRDVTARRWEERQIRQAQKLDALGKLAFGVSNDYLNLVGIIRHQADQLLRQFGDYSPARKAVDEIQQAASVAEQISRRLAVFGTRHASRPEVISLNAVLRRATKLIESVTGAKIEVSIRTEPATGRINADAGQIEQVILSLILHACTTMPDGGRMLIETGNAELPLRGRMHPYTLLAITYTGEEPDPDRLFEPSSTSEAGLALSEAHSLVNEHAGHLTAQRTAGGCCRFEMLLPRWTGKPLLPRPNRGGAPAILLIDDRDRIRVQLHNFFEANGFNLLEAADLNEALAVSQVHEGPLGLLIAEERLADAIANDLHRVHPNAGLLRVVDREETGAHEICRPFTQQQLLDRVQALLSRTESTASSGACQDSTPEQVK